jgi:cytochrome c oxidase cbb3-type subunit III
VIRELVGLAVGALVLGACEREERAFRPDPVASEAPEPAALSPIAPGPAPGQAERGRKGEGFERNAYHVSQGKMLYLRFNCIGCHANGGGGMGPALMDDIWTYGGRIENIVATIRDGRPNGMPAFRERIPEDQLWQISAYVRSMSRAVRKDVAPGRSDTMNPGPAENRRPFNEPGALKSGPP